MLAESIHSLADSGNQGLLLLGGRRAQQAATEEHPFGYGRERYFWAFVVSVVLFVLGSLFALYEGIDKLPEELLVAGKVELPAALTFDQVCSVIDDAERRVREAVPIARVTYLEPDHPETDRTLTSELGGSESST